MNAPMMGKKLNIKITSSHFTWQNNNILLIFSFVFSLQINAGYKINLCSKSSETE